MSFANLNAFALLGLEVRPWLELEAVQGRVAVTVEALGQENTASLARHEEVKEARRILSNPRLRLQHLFELSWPSEERASGPTFVPKALEHWFEEAADLERRLTTFLARKSASPSSLGRALLAQEAMALREQAEVWLARLSAHEAEWLTALREWDIRWQKGEPAARSREVLALFSQAFAYLGKWRDAVSGHVFALLEVH